MKEQKFGTGFREEAQPLRIYDYETVFGAQLNYDISQFPDYYQIPNERIGIIKNQGYVGACVACVMSSLAEVLEKIEAEKDGRNLEKEDIEFSEGWAYGALRSEEMLSWGMCLPSALEYWRKLGMVPKKYFNILEEMPTMRKKVEQFPELYDIAKRYSISSYTKISYALKEKRDFLVKEALYNRKYGLVAVSREAFSEPHCIMLIGWNDKKDSYIFKNSWGSKWSLDGISEISKDSVNEIYVVSDEEITLPFTDVTTNDWNYGDIKNVYCSNLMQGVSSTEFKPLQNITRAEAATLVVRLVDLINDRLENIVKILKIKNNKSDNYYIPSEYLVQKIYESKIPFTDVSEKTWYYDNIQLAYEYGLLNGKTENIFDPNAEITRAEMASLIVRITDAFTEKLNYILKKTNKITVSEEKESIKFVDVSKEDWFYSAVKTIFNLRIMTGKENNCFDPNGFTTRGETAVIINRLSKYIDSKNYIALQ